MAAPAEALQRAVFAALEASAPVAEALGGDGRPRIFDEVPQPDPGEAVPAYRRRVPMPYITIGDDDFLGDHTECLDSWEATVIVHVWSRATGKVEAKRIGDVVEDALDVVLEISGFTCVEHEARTARYFKDPDGETTHGVLEFRYLIDRA